MVLPEPKWVEKACHFRDRAGKARKSSTHRCCSQVIASIFCPVILPSNSIALSMAASMAHIRPTTSVTDPNASSEFSNPRLTLPADLATTIFSLSFLTNAGSLSIGAPSMTRKRSGESFTTNVLPVIRDVALCQCTVLAILSLHRLMPSEGRLRRMANLVVLLLPPRSRQWLQVSGWYTPAEIPETCDADISV